MQSRWMTAVTLALLIGAPVAIDAQTSTDTGTKGAVEKTKEAAGSAVDKTKEVTGKAVDKTKEVTGKATAATKDSWITAKTKIALYGDDRVSGGDINVDTKSGMVTLRGKVASADGKRAAEEVAKTVDGVTSVRNDLQVVAPAERKAVNAEDKDVKNAVQKKIKQDARLKGADIEVRVDRGVVTLMGDVKDVGSRARASEVARSVPGVRSVKNELREKTS